MPSTTAKLTSVPITLLNYLLKRHQLKRAILAYRIFFSFYVTRQFDFLYLIHDLMNTSMYTTSMFTRHKIQLQMLYLECQNYANNSNIKIMRIIRTCSIRVSTVIMVYLIVVNVGVLFWAFQYILVRCEFGSADCVCLNLMLLKLTHFKLQKLVLLSTIAWHCFQLSKSSEYTIIKDKCT